MTEESEGGKARNQGAVQSDPDVPFVQPGLALQELAAVHPELASALARLTMAIASEALHNQRLARALSEVCRSQGVVDPASARSSPGGRRSRRSAGPWDPFVVYAEQGEAALRDRLTALDLEQLRDIIAEHGMDTDRLAMKWRDPSRVVDRIVERVVDRAAKGDAFRSPHRQR